MTPEVGEKGPLPDDGFRMRKVPRPNTGFYIWTSRGLAIRAKSNFDVRAGLPLAPLRANDARLSFP